MFGDLVVLAIVVLPVILTFVALRATPLRYELVTDAAQELAGLL
jgi:hypothetical protein